MSTSQGTYSQIVQTSEAIRETYKMSRESGGMQGLELRAAALKGHMLLAVKAAC